MCIRDSTTPLKNSAQGLVRATRPLSYGGELIEDFWIRFENGKAVGWGAEENEKLLGDIINMDEGSCYLGECALVPCDSPINKSGILFYNTLFDENAACHLALGRGYTNTVKNFASYEMCIRDRPESVVSPPPANTPSGMSPRCV